MLSKFDSKRSKITDMIVSTGVDEEKFGMYKGKENLKFQMGVALLSDTRGVSAGGKAFGGVQTDGRTCMTKNEFQNLKASNESSRVQSRGTGRLQNQESYLSVNNIGK